MRTALPLGTVGDADGVQETKALIFICYLRKVNGDADCNARKLRLVGVCTLHTVHRVVNYGTLRLVGVCTQFRGNNVVFQQWAIFVLYKIIVLFNCTKMSLLK